MQTPRSILRRAGRPSSRWLILAVLVGLVLLTIAVVLGPRAVSFVRHHVGGNYQTALAPPPPNSLRAVPDFGHAWIIVLENKSAAEIIGKRSAPFLNALIAQSGLSESYQAVSHPSQPNYIGLISGGTQGVTSNDPTNLTATTLLDQLDRAGRSWRVYAENYPGHCFTGATATGGPDGPGTYVRRHNPAISFPTISQSPSRCANIQDLSSFDPGAADLEIIIPNVCHDMHDCSVAAGDAWLRTFVPRIVASPAFRSSGALFITFDEGAQNGSDAANTVATIVTGPGVPRGFRSTTAHTHYSLLRTLEDAWHLGCLGQSCAANTLGEFFGR